VHSGWIPPQDSVQTPASVALDGEFDETSTETGLDRSRVGLSVTPDTVCVALVLTALTADMRWPSLIPTGRFPEGFMASAESVWHSATLVSLDLLSFFSDGFATDSGLFGPVSSLCDLYRRSQPLHQLWVDWFGLSEVRNIRTDSALSHLRARTFSARVPTVLTSFATTEGELSRTVADCPRFSA
jgi:hypothetical protein